ncbi:protein-L-isoaspartate(D-aspartate) O-methyltransferase [Sphingomonas sp. LaA6.9]|uniref:protein-L-isoaspartate(D-aspartate) O-methyltransferase n=1 Tax=Sphingomonas sp. LaA6.9 TaxID=2919914 RepID=UPI001F4FF7E9|nr:protein-L-isoaspartate(D-aspartate) O-methyltransferase [Sphingomonas sp. LaA6.9]MCJ8157029.1 protein-L-isoaspartate(D-aspartate) O-methyltransferase [Sphingomonas sp. LaA6.9]
MKRLEALFAILFVAITPLPPTETHAAGEPEQQRRFAAERARLVDAIRNYGRPIGESANPGVLAAMRAVPRHLFVPTDQRAEAYQDYPLPIGEGQTISQPSLIALMTHLLRPKKGEVMLEVGTGSGYQAAILSRLVGRVYSIEIVEPLARQAAATLTRLGYANIAVRHGDGYAGWPEHAPFDGIIVTAGAPHVPKPLLDQLKPGGRMVIPVGPSHSTQRLMLITKDARGKTVERFVIAVRFVPLTRKIRS